MQSPRLFVTSGRYGKLYADTSERSDASVSHFAYSRWSLVAQRAPFDILKRSNFLSLDFFRASV